MFATIKSLIPEPRQADQPRRYVGRHRQPDPQPAEPRPETEPTEAPTAEESEPAGVQG